MRITELELNYPEPTFPGGLSVTEMRTILLEMDWLNGEDVQAATSRCNNRCNGNDTEASVPIIKVRT